MTLALAAPRMRILNGRTRRKTLGSLVAAPLLGYAQIFPSQQPPDPQHPDTPRLGHDDDQRLPNGKSQKNEIARQNYEQSLKDADAMVEAAQSLRDDLKKAGTYVVSVASLRKTEDIERLARRIRGRLKS
jgi:hypothetical protein